MFSFLFPKEMITRFVKYTKNFLLQLDQNLHYVLIFTLARIKFTPWINFYSAKNKIYAGWIKFYSIY